MQNLNLQGGAPRWTGTEWKGTGSRSEKVKEQWGNLTDDDLDVINGRRDHLEGKSRSATGTTKIKSGATWTTGTVGKSGEPPRTLVQDCAPVRPDSRHRRAM